MECTGKCANYHISSHPGDSHAVVDTSVLLDAISEGPDEEFYNFFQRPGATYKTPDPS